MKRSLFSTLTGIGLAAVVATQYAAPAQAVLHITPAAGYSINWDGNDGAFFSVAATGQVPNNLALASNGTTPFASSQFGANHLTVKLNDGNYGNADSWIANGGDPLGAFPAAGVAFSAVQSVTSVAWGRDNGNNTNDCCGGQLTDRSVGVYTLQRTTVAAPGAATAVTGDAATGWETIGTLNYYGNTDAFVGGGFTSFLRHEYQIAFNGGPVAATGLRITAPNGNAIDEIEAFSASVNTGLTLVQVGPAVSPVVPNNLALASNGSVAFAKDLLNGDGFGVHSIAALNDGVYGNSNSWIGNSNPTFAGIALAAPTVIGEVAFGRDSDGQVSFADRAAGVYLLQYTTDASPSALTDDSSWITIGSATLDPSDPDRFLRHLYSFDPVLATGVRIITMNGNEGQIAIDEIEIFAGVIAVPEPATMSLLGLGVLALVRRRRQQA